MVRIITGGGEVLSNKTSKNTVKITHKIKVFIIGWGIKPTTHSTSYQGPDARFISARNSQRRQGHLCTQKPGSRGCAPPRTRDAAAAPRQSLRRRDKGAVLAYLPEPLKKVL